MTKNTLRFVAPIKVGAKQKVDTSILEPKEENPASWTNEMLRKWLETEASTVDAD
jgi:acyl dehydratase